MRVTDRTKHESVTKNMQQNMQRLQTLQTNLSSGQRIHRPSDDPLGATVAQDIVTTISRKEQFDENLHANLKWLELNEGELQHMADLMNQAKLLLISQAGSSASEETRRVTAQEIRDIREAMLDSANAKEGKLFLFSGTKTFTRPLEKTNPLQSAKVQTEDIAQKDVAELLDVDQFQAQFEGQSLNPYRVRIERTGPFGFARYQVSDDEGKTWSKAEILKPTIKVMNPDGKPDDQVLLRFTDEQGLLGSLLPANALTETAFFDIANAGVLFPEGMEFVFLPKPPISYMGNRQRKEVLTGEGVSTPLSLTAEEILLKTDEQSVDVFQIFDSTEKSLLENDQEALAERISDFEKGLEQILKKQSDIGNTTRDLEKAKLKLEDQVFSAQKELSSVQDLDIAESSVELNTAELNNKVSLDAGGRLIQPSLLNFLR